MASNHLVRPSFIRSAFLLSKIEQLIVGQLQQDGTKQNKQYRKVTHILSNQSRDASNKHTDIYTPPVWNIQHFMLQGMLLSMWRVRRFNCCYDAILGTVIRNNFFYPVSFSQASAVLLSCPVSSSPQNLAQTCFAGYGSQLMN